MLRRYFLLSVLDHPMLPESRESTTQTIFMLLIAAIPMYVTELIRKHTRCSLKSGLTVVIPQSFKSEQTPVWVSSPFHPPHCILCGGGRETPAMAAEVERESKIAMDYRTERVEAQGRGREAPAMAAEFLRERKTSKNYRIERVETLNLKARFSVISH